MTAGILKIRLVLLIIKGKFLSAKGTHRQTTRTITRPASDPVRQLGRETPLGAPPPPEPSKKIFFFLSFSLEAPRR